MAPTVSTVELEFDVIVLTATLSDEAYLACKTEIRSPYSIGGILLE